jgi:DNA-binding CsgD family transcriptional regulator
VRDVLRTDIVRMLERHPQIVSYRTRPDDIAPRRLSDLISQRQWQAHPVYRAIGAAVGNRYQLTVLVRPGSATFDGWVFNRTTRDFSDAELGRLRWAQAGLVSLNTQIRLDSPTDHAATTAAARIGITSRERQVLELLSRGLTAQAIAHVLLISERTVRKHLERTYRKLGCRDRLQAVQLATSVGVLDPPPGQTWSCQRTVEPPAASAASIRAS